MNYPRRKSRTVDKISTFLIHQSGAGDSLNGMRAHRLIHLLALTILPVSTYLLVTAAPTCADANPLDQDDYITYDQIVDDLQTQDRAQNRLQVQQQLKKRSSREAILQMRGQEFDPFRDIWIHAGVGLAQTIADIEMSGHPMLHLSTRGVQASFGIDILSPSFAAEGTVRSFEETHQKNMNIQLKEFDLKILAKHRRGAISYRAGVGLSARYLTLTSQAESYDYTTPASVFQLGTDLYLSSTVSVGFDLSARTAMISETIDRTSYDGTLRLDTHF